MSSVGGEPSPEDVDYARRPTKSRSVQMEEIQELAKAYATSKVGCPFTVGQWVTPRPEMGIVNSGEPHLVIEVRKDATYHFSAWFDNSVSGQGQLLDIRVLCFEGDHAILAYWGESWTFEPYYGQA